MAYDANPNTGFAVYDSIPDEGYVGWEEVGGTSAGAPQWSALVAIADQGRVAASENTLTNAAAAVYTLPSSDFHDVTSGSNGQYSASQGLRRSDRPGHPVANLVAQGLVGVTTAQQTFTTATLTTTPHRGGFFGSAAASARFDDVDGDDSSSLLMTGVTFNSAAGSSLGANAVVNVGSQLAAGPTTTASRLTTSLLASATVQQAPGDLRTPFCRQPTWMRLRPTRHRPTRWPQAYRPPDLLWRAKAKRSITRPRTWPGRR